MSRVPARLVERWLDAWPEAQAAWGTTTRVHPPVLHTETAGPAAQVGSFAWYDSSRVEVHVDLADVVRRGLDDHAVAVLAHEVGHHVLAPAHRRTALRVAARARAGLVDQDHLVGPVANLWQDLLINDRLQRTGRADLAGVWRTLGAPTDPLMGLVLRACELLWELPRTSLCGTAVPVDEGAAWLCARLVRVYARDPVGGAGGFASLVRTTLPESALTDALASSVLHVVCGDASGELPHGLAGDGSLVAPVVHPSLDPAVVGGSVDPDEQARPTADASAEGSAAGSPGNTLLPADLHALVKALGGTTSLEDVAVAWYREQASRHLVPFPQRRSEQPVDPLLGGLDPWEVGDDLGDVDWTGTVTASPVVVPGVTTLRRAFHEDQPVVRDDAPVDLDLYLDSSGSMPDPKRFSWVALAGAVLALSALRVGARVQATTWSGPGQVAGTDGFTRDPDAVLRAVVAHFGGSTAFPLPVLARTFLGEAGRPPLTTRATHVAVVSDDGVATMTGTGWPPTPDPEQVAVRALAAAGGGGSLLLDVPAGGRDRVVVPEGYDTYWVDGDAALVDFARDFARRTWSAPQEGRR